jgi:hypothetical protein
VSTIGACRSRDLKYALAWAVQGLRAESVIVPDSDALELVGVVLEPTTPRLLLPCR